MLKKILNAFYRRCFSNCGLVRIGADSSVYFKKVYGKPGGHLIIGASPMVDGSIYFDRDNPSVSAGDRTYIGAPTIVGANVCANKIEIGSDVLIAWGGTVVDHNSHAINRTSRMHDVIAWQKRKKDWSNAKIGAVKINDKAWIGFNSIILKGVTIGEGQLLALEVW